MLRERRFNHREHREHRGRMKRLHGLFLRDLCVLCGK
jgi:hypothetical protein